MHFFFNDNARTKFTGVFDQKHAAISIFVCVLTIISAVLCICRNAQIAPSIIRRILIYVINRKTWPLASLKNPNNLMRPNGFVAKRNFNAAAFLRTYVASEISSLRSCIVNAPTKLAIIGIIRKELADLRRIDIRHKASVNANMVLCNI